MCYITADWPVKYFLPGFYTPFSRKGYRLCHFYLKLLYSIDFHDFMKHKIYDPFKTDDTKAMNMTIKKPALIRGPAPILINRKINPNLYSARQQLLDKGCHQTVVGLP